MELRLRNSAALLAHVERLTAAARTIAATPMHTPAAALRHYGTRPGQPRDLTRYDKGEAQIPPPKSIFTAESNRMGRFDFESMLPDEGVRAVPKSPVDFAAARVAYNEAMSGVRKRYSAEWSARREREAEAVAEYRARVREAMATTAEARAKRKAATAATTSARLSTLRETRRLKQALATRANELRAVSVHERRLAWLDALEADAKSAWITEDRIDELITPSIFSVKYGWQYTTWFSEREKRRQKMEDARRAQKPGVPLREPEASDDEYAEDWEPMPEGDASSASAAEAAADRNAAGDARVALALATARRAARAAGKRFLEPDYDDDGQPLAPASGALERMKRTGISLEDLYYGGRSEATPTSSADDVADDLFGSNDTARDAATTAAAAIDNEYTATPAPASSASPLGRVSVDEAAAEGDAGDEGVEAVAAELSEEASAAAAAAAEEDSAAASAAAAAEEAAAIAAAAEDAAQRELQLLDSAERRAENAYIRKCIQLESVEALYYALLRKRTRLARDYPSATRDFDAKWGPWMRIVAGDSTPSVPEDATDAVAAALGMQQHTAVSGASASTAAAGAADSTPGATVDGPR